MLVNFLISFYLMGVIIFCCLYLPKWWGFTQAQNNIDIDDNERQQLKRLANYQWQKTIFWPYYLFIKTNPIDLLSRNLFMRYGNPHTKYFGNHGLKNFLNDLIKGKNRYKNCQIHHIFFELSKNSQLYQEESQFFGGNGIRIYASIVCTQYKDKY